MSETAPKPKWWQEFTRPVAFVSLTLAVVALLFGWYAYYQTVERPRLSWIMQKQIVFDYHNASPAITVLDSDGKKMASNVYASEFTFWNSGNTRFDNVDESTIVRQPLTFALEGDGRILSASITRSRHNMAGSWSIETSPKSATMRWRHFDPEAAVQILILFTGDRSDGIQPTISIAGHSVLDSPKDTSPTEIALTIVSAILMVFVLPSFFIPSRWDKVAKRLFLVGFAVFGIVLAICEIQWFLGPGVPSFSESDSTHSS